MPFKNLERGDELCIDLLVTTKFYKLDSNLLNGEFQIFGESIYFDKLLNKSCYTEFIESDELFFGSWEFVENKFLNFNGIVCFFNPVSLSNLDMAILYEYILIKRYEGKLIVSFIDVHRNSLNLADNVRRSKICKYEYLRFNNNGFSLYVDTDLTVDFYGLEYLSIVREKSSKSDQADFVKIIEKENPS